MPGLHQILGISQVGNLYEEEASVQVLCPEFDDMSTDFVNF